MAFLSFTLTALLSAVNPVTPPLDMACQFDKTTWVSVRPHGETKTPGLFKVRLWIKGQALVGTVIALDKTEARDVVVRGLTGDHTTWMIAIRDNGAAYLRRKASTPKAQVVSATGECSNFETAFEVWLD